MFTAKKQIAPATSPMRIAGIGPTNPDAGVIATSPATAPDAAPSTLALPRARYSARHQVSVAAAAARWVTTNADVASAPDASALPPLNPNHPNQRMPAPRT